MAEQQSKLIPETVLKRQKRDQEYQKEYKKLKEDRVLRKQERRQEYFKRAETYALEYKQEEEDLERLKREAIEARGFYVPDEPKLGFVIRIKGIHKIHPKISRILELLRLNRLFHGAFIKLNKSNLKNLRLVEPYIAWGYPNLESVKSLIYKRGYGKLHRQVVPLTNNDLIEEYFTKKKVGDIICIEDIVHEIYKVGPNFKKANSFLQPFKLRAPKLGISKKRKHYIMGGQFGNREDLINNLIQRMV